MSKQDLSQKDAKSGTTVQIIVAVITVVGVLGAAFLTNWENIFHKKIPEPPKASTPSIPAMRGTATPNLEQSTKGSQSPVVSDVNGNVTINFGEPKLSNGGKQSEVQPVHVANISGEWEAKITYDGKNECLDGFNFTVVGMEFYGTASLCGKLSEIKDGKLNGNDLTFSTKTEGSGSDKESFDLHRYQGVVSKLENEISFVMQTKAKEFQHASIKFIARKVPD